MVLFADVHPILKAGRIFGCTSYISTENDIKPRKPSDIFFIAFAVIVYLSIIGLMHFYTLYIDIANAKYTTLYITRVLLFYTCLFGDITLTALWNGKIRCVFSQLRTFDRTVKFHEASNQILIRSISRILVAIVFTFWTLLGYINYKNGANYPILQALFYIVIDISVCMQILIFVGILYLIEQRFRRLCKILVSTPGVELTVTGRLYGRFTLQQIWWLHCSLVHATEMLNSVYAIQLLLWISSMSFNLMSRIYVLNMFEQSGYGTMKDLMLAFICIWNLLLITLVCHSTSRQANRVGEIIFASMSTICMKRVGLQDNLEAVAYFQMRKVHFYTIGGFLRVDLPLLLSIVSTMTTYLVILL